jgi:hypothetical protein
MDITVVAIVNDHVLELDPGNTLDASNRLGDTAANRRSV